jgi:hypothetical protein
MKERRNGFFLINDKMFTQLLNKKNPLIAHLFAADPFEFFLYEKSNVPGSFFPSQHGQLEQISGAGVYDPRSLHFPIYIHVE